MTAGNLDLLQYSEDALDLVSARFADLVAQSYQQDLLDRISWRLFQAACEEDFAQQLLESIGGRSGDQRLVYVALDQSSQAPLTVTHGLLETPRLFQSPSRFLLSQDAGSLIGGALVSLALGPEFPAAAGLVLRDPSGSPIAVVAMERQPEDTMVIDFLDRLTERASQSLAQHRLRKGLEQAGRTLHRQQMNQHTQLLGLLEDWTLVLSRVEDRYNLWGKLLEAAVHSLGADKGCLLLLDDHRSELVVRASYGLDQEVHGRIQRGEQICRCLKLGEGVAGGVTLSLQPVIVNQVDQEVFLEPLISQVGSLLCLPLHLDGLALGVMTIAHNQNGRHFQQQQMIDGMKLASQAALAVNNSRLYRLAVLDPSTEVYSRSHLFQRTRDELGRARRYQRSVALLAIRLSGLAEVRDNHGHETGNRVETRFCEVLLECVRETDMVARLGDGSFAVLMPETDGPTGMFAAERVCQHSGDCDVLASYSVVPHIGLCSYPERAESVSQLISRAEQAMTVAACTSESLPVVLCPLPGGNETPQLIDGFRLVS